MNRKISSEKLELAQLYESGNTDLRTFCELHKVKKSNLYYWRKKLKENDIEIKSGKFLPIDISPSISEALRIEIHFSTGDSIIANQLLPLPYLRSLLDK